jgi:hypothetical protein
MRILCQNISYKPKQNKSAVISMPKLVEFNLKPSCAFFAKISQTNLNKITEQLFQKQNVINILYE